MRDLGCEETSRLMSSARLLAPRVLLLLWGPRPCKCLLEWECMSKQRVLFLCTHNSARSQMAEGLLRAADTERFEVHSAGTEATTRVRPEAAQVMAELGIDISKHESKSLQRYIDQRFDWVIAVCDAAAEVCPVFPGRARRLHWSLPDPSQVDSNDAQRVAVFRAVRDQLKQLLGEFVSSDSQTGRGALARQK